MKFQSGTAAKRLSAKLTFMLIFIDSLLKKIRAAAQATDTIFFYVYLPFPDT